MRPEIQSDDKIEIREATELDNEALLALTRATPMGGKIALRIDREPDFFRLLRARGEAIVYVATHEGVIIGCLSAAVHVAYVRGALEKIAHVGDMKVHPQFRGRGITLRLIGVLQVRLQAECVDVCFSLVADGNKPVMTIAEGKHGTPAQVQLGRFFVEQLIPSPFAGRSKKYAIERAAEQDLKSIVTILDQVSRDRNFSPRITVEEIRECAQRDHSAPFCAVLVARDGGRIVATLTVDDTRNFRQNVLVGLPSALRILLLVLRVLTFPIPGFNVPRLDAELPMLYVRYLGCKAGHEEALRALLSQARKLAYEQRVTFLSLGLHERDPMRPVVDGILRFTFTSRSMATSAITPERVKTLVDLIPYEDFALV